MRKETVAIDILVIPRNDKRKIMQFIRIISKPTSRIRRWNQLSQFKWTFTKARPAEKTLAGYMSTMSQAFKRGSKWRINSPTYLFLQSILEFQVVARSPSPGMTAIFHRMLYGRFIEIYREQPQEKKNSYNKSRLQFPWWQFSNRDNVRAPIQFRRENQP